MAPPARLLVEELGSEYVQYSFSSQLVFRCGARAAVNEIAKLTSFFGALLFVDEVADRLIKLVA